MLNIKHCDFVIFAYRIYATNRNYEINERYSQSAKKFPLLIYANSGEVIERKARLRVLEWRNSNAKYFQSRSFILKVLALSHLAPNAWSFPTSRSHHSLYPHTNCTLCTPAVLATYESSARKITKFPGSRLKSSRQFYHFFVSPVLCFLITCVTLLTTSLFGYCVIPWTTKIISRKKYDIWLLFNNIGLLQIWTIEYLIRLQYNFSTQKFRIN